MTGSDVIGSWEHWAAERALPYLLPGATHESVSLETAQALLARLHGDGDRARIPNARRLCLAMCLTGPAAPLVETLFGQHLRRLVEQLPTSATPTPRHWQGGYRGKLDVTRTFAAQAHGDPGHFVTRDRVRHFDRPENIVLRHAVETVHRSIVELRTAGVTPEEGWAAGLLRVRSSSERALNRTALVHVPDRTPTNADLAVASAHKDPGFRAAAALVHCIAQATSGPDVQAEMLARALVQPRHKALRFQLAVLLRVVHLVDTHVLPVAGEPWQRAEELLTENRGPVVAWKCADGLRLEVWYDTVGWVPGVHERFEFQQLQKKYLGRSGLSRPDVVLTAQWKDVDGNAHTSAILFEVKLSESLDYTATGLMEALFYSREFAEFLPGWPKAVAVGALDSSSTPSTMDDVFYVAWRDDWSLFGVGMVDTLVAGHHP